MCSALMMTLGVTPANAIQDSAAERISDLVDSVAPAQGEVQQTDRVSTGFVSDIAQLPATESAPVVVAGGSGEMPLQVSLPSETNTRRGVSTSDGTVVYLAADGGADVAAQVLESDRVRIQTVIHDSGDSHEFSYHLGNGYVPVQAADGTYWAYRFDDDGQINLYGIGAAWARDATGANVETRYEIRGNELVQVVSPNASAAYPIVADPTWEWYNAAYGAGFSKRETRDLANLGGIAGLCSSLWKWPALGAACGIAGFQWWTQAGLAVNANGCVFIAAVPAPLAVRWLSGNCR
ncbi:hypothetical protein [Microbacterium sp. T32]|uniref:hypothetical protein n=1 Tax=Microbacterium sp. T32 TaxID=1776083 RepID=UPI0012E70499|nr:hypothetical protein [Microbacterium sp. T32]